MQKSWWKIAAVILLLYTVIYGFLGEVPRQPILNETIRNLYFHVTMWFGMITLLSVSIVNSVKYLSKGDMYHDLRANEYNKTAIVFGILGCITGSIWGKFSWGDYWPNDPKLNAVAIGMLIYLAYMVLRSSMPDPQKRARICAVYNIFAFAVFIPLIFVLPRMVASLHPGNGGNPGLKPAETTVELRIVFYPAIVGWTLLGVWITSLKIRFAQLQEKFNTNNNE
jgi:heme exporter protein C